MGDLQGKQPVILPRAGPQEQGKHRLFKGFAARRGLQKLRILILLNFPPHEVLQIFALLLGYFKSFGPAEILIQGSSCIKVQLYFRHLCTIKTISRSEQSSTERPTDLESCPMDGSFSITETEPCTVLKSRMRGLFKAHRKEASEEATRPNLAQPRLWWRPKAANLLCEHAIDHIS